MNVNIVDFEEEYRNVCRDQNNIKINELIKNCIRNLKNKKLVG